MTWPRIALYYVVAALLGAYLYAEISGRQVAEDTAVSAELPFVVTLASRIDRVRIERGDLTADFRRVSGRWQLVEPAGVDAHGEIVEAILDTLTRIAPIEVVSSDESAAGQFGLNPARTRLRIESEGEIVSTLAFGQRNPTRTAVYARKSGEAKVYLLGLNAQYYVDLIFENIARATPGRQVVAEPGVAE